MRRFIIYLALICISLQGIASERDSLWNVAVEAYSQGEFQNALDGFLALEKEGFASPELYYNIGNSYYNLSGYLAHSVLYYEKALKLDPSNKDARANLEFVHQFTLDKIESVPEFVLITWFKSLRNIFSSNGWAYVALAFLAITAVLLLIFRFGRSMVLRKISFIFAIIMFIFMAVSIVCSLGLRGEIIRDDGAIVMKPVSSVKSSPNESGKSLFIIHEGTKVRILEELGMWCKVELSDGRQGWMLKQEIEII